MPTIVNVTSAEQDDIRNAISRMIARLPGQITDPDLRDCIRRKAQGNGQVINHSEQVEGHQFDWGVQRVAQHRSDRDLEIGRHSHFDEESRGIKPGGSGGHADARMGALVLLGPWRRQRRAEMNPVVIFFARVLALLGFGRRYFHVDARCEIHVSARTTDAAAGAALDAVEFLIERPAAVRETAPFQRLVGTTDAVGRIDVKAMTYWSYESADMTKPAPPPPSMTLIARKTGYQDVRRDFQILQLAGAGSVRELNVGVIAMATV